MNLVMKPQPVVAEQIKRTRKLLGLTQADVAKRMGKEGSQTMVSRWESDRQPSLSSVIQLAEAIEVEPRVFMFEVEELDDTLGAYRLLGMLSDRPGKPVPVYSLDASTGSRTPTTERAPDWELLWAFLLADEYRDDPSLASTHPLAWLAVVDSIVREWNAQSALDLRTWRAFVDLVKSRRGEELPERVSYETIGLTVDDVQRMGRTYRRQAYEKDIGEG